VQSPYIYRQPSTYQVTYSTTRTVGPLAKVKGVFVNQGGSVVKAQEVYVNDSGTLRKIHQAVPNSQFNN
jgi:hypothetical protein